MTRVIADLSRCQGYANCLMADPERFDLDDEGLVKVLVADVGADLEEHVARAIQSCPTLALRLER
jgi:ferredoxin